LISEDHSTLRVLYIAELGDAGSEVMRRATAVGGTVAIVGHGVIRGVLMDVPTYADLFLRSVIAGDHEERFERAPAATRLHERTQHTSCIPSSRETVLSARLRRAPRHDSARGGTAARRCLRCRSLRKRKLDLTS
jgi:hypothetical protein